MQVKPSQAKSILSKLLRAKLVPMLVGSPGTGKSSIVREIAEQHNLFVIDLRLSQCDPTDLMGFPTIVGERAGYRPMETFPIEGDELPINPATGKQYDGWLLFLDEFNSASPAVQAAAYKIVLDKMVGRFHLHKRVGIICAGNLETDNAIVQPMSTALQSRLVHLELKSDLVDFLDWAYAHGIDRRITSYLNYRPGNLYAFDANHTDYTYACNRTWEFADRILKVTQDGDPDRLPMLAGAISEGVAREFSGFCAIDNQLPKISAITANPQAVVVPEEPSVLFMLTGALSHHMNENTVTDLLTYLKRLPREFQIVCLRETIRRNKPLLGHKAMQQWVTEAATELF